MPFSPAQLQELAAAVNSNNLQRIDALIKPHWKYEDYSRADAKYKFNEIELSFLTACRFELKNVIAKYLESRTFNTLTLSLALLDACGNGLLDTVKILIEQGHADPNEPSDLSLNLNRSDPSYELAKVSKLYPFEFAISGQRKNVIEYFITLKNFDINKVFECRQAKNYTYLLTAYAKNQADTCKFLLEHGANPLIRCVPKTPSTPFSFHDMLTAQARVDDEEINLAMAEMYLEWLSKNKHREQQFAEAAALITAGHSPSSSGSNSPMSLGSADNSPTGSPPKPSAIVRHSPPDSPVASRNGSPPNSPMKLSDSSSSSSSGSAGSSPERLSVQSVGTSQLTKLSVESDLDDEFKKAIYSNKFNEAKALYDTGRVRLNSSFIHDKKQKNVLQIVLTDFEYDLLEKYMLYHPKYPANINSVNCDKQTILHLKMQADHELNTIPSKKGVIAIMQKYADKKPNVNVQDKFGNTPLHYAAASGGINSHEAVDELLKNSADASIRNKEGLTAEEYCKKNCLNEEVKQKVLLAFKSNYPQQQPVASPLAKTSGESDLDEEFKKAIYSNKFNEAKALYDTGRVRLHSSFIHDKKQKNVLQIILMDAGYGDLEKYLLYHSNHPANINSVNCDKQTILHLKMQQSSNTNLIPSKKGVIAIMQKYADKKPNVNAQDNFGNTPLHYAAASGGINSHEAVDELLKNSADASIRNKEGLTAEEYCKKHCPNEEVKQKVLGILNPRQSVAHAPSNDSPIIYSASNRALLFNNQNSVARNTAVGLTPVSVPMPITVSRAEPAQIGAIYVPPPLSLAQLPRPIKKPCQIMVPPEIMTPATTHTDNKKSNSSGVSNKIKSLLGK